MKLKHLNENNEQPSEQSELQRRTEEITRLKDEYDKASQIVSHLIAKSVKFTSKEYRKARRAEKLARRAWMNARGGMRHVRTSKPKGFKSTGSEDWAAVKADVEPKLRKNVIALWHWNRTIQNMGRSWKKSTHILKSQNSWKYVLDAIRYVVEHRRTQILANPEPLFDKITRDLNIWRMGFGNYLPAPAPGTKDYDRFYNVYQPHISAIAETVLKQYKLLTYANAQLLNQQTVASEDDADEEPSDK